VTDGTVVDVLSRRDVVLTAASVKYISTIQPRTAAPRMARERSAFMFDFQMASRWTGSSLGDVAADDRCDRVSFRTVPTLGAMARAFNCALVLEPAA